MRISKITSVTETSRCKALGSESSLMLHHYINKDLTPTDMWEYVEEVEVNSAIYDLFYSGTKSLYMVYIKFEDTVWYKLLTPSSLYMYTEIGDIKTLLKPVPMVNVKELEVFPIVEDDKICFTSGSKSRIVELIENNKRGDLSENILIGTDNYYITKVNDSNTNFTIDKLVNVYRSRFFYNFKVGDREVYLRANYFNKLSENFVSEEDLMFKISAYKEKARFEDCKDNIFIDKVNKKAYYAIDNIYAQALDDAYGEIKKGSNFNIFYNSTNMLNEVFGSDNLSISQKIELKTKAFNHNNIKQINNLVLISVEEFIKSLEEDDIYVLYKR